MKGIKEFLKWLALVLAMAPFVYVFAYLLFVQRLETVSAPSRKITGRIATDHVIQCRAPSLLSLDDWYLPLAKLDDRYVRPHRWHSFTVSQYPDGRLETNFAAQSTWELARWSRSLQQTGLMYTNADGSIFFLHPSAPTNWAELAGKIEVVRQANESRVSRQTGSPALAPAP